LFLIRGTLSGTGSFLVAVKMRRRLVCGYEGSPVAGEDSLPPSSSGKFDLVVLDIWALVVPCNKIVKTKWKQ
jgi:hypothetical protein